jgi:two-component system sensor histidine kinase ChvG
MTLASRIDVRDKTVAHNADVVLGDDWVAPDATADNEIRAHREKRGLISINRSPLARKIITFNLLAIILMVAGVLYLNPFRDSLVFQRQNGLVTEAQLIANAFKAQMPEEGAVDLASNDVIDVRATLESLALSDGVEVFVYDTNQAQPLRPLSGLSEIAARH